MKMKKLSKEQHEVHPIKQPDKAKAVLHKTATNINPSSRKEANSIPHSQTAYNLLKSQSEQINRQNQSILFTQLRPVYTCQHFFNALASTVQRCAVRIEKEASITTASQGGVNSSEPNPEARRDFQP